MSIATSPAAKAASLACSVVLFTLAACGGGGEAPPDETKAEAPTERALARPTPPGGTVIDADCRLKGFASLALQRINSYRASGATCGERGTFAPTTPLAWNAALIASSTRLSKDMAANNFFSHIGSDGSDLVQRVNDVGYVWYALGENIAAGQRTVNDVVDAWMSSSAHCASIMEPMFRDVGLACVKGNRQDTYSTYWTMDFGANVQ